MNKEYFKDNKNQSNIYTVVYYVCCIFVITLLLIICYGYNSGSCYINNKTGNLENETFNLIKEFDFEGFSEKINDDIKNMVNNENIQSKVSIITNPEIILNCATPNRSGITIPTMTINENSKDLIYFYQNDLRKRISDMLGIEVYPTDLSMPTSCAIIIYNRENDWINWHYDHNYYNGNFFTVLIPITKEKTCSLFQYINNDNEKEIVSIDIKKNKAVVFEGDYIYHRASKLCKNQKRIVLSCQYVTDNSISYFNKLRIKIKDYAFIGKLFT